MAGMAGNTTSPVPQSQMCIELPPEIHSQGIIGLRKGGPGMNFSLPTGIVLGPSLLGASELFKKHIFPRKNKTIIEVLGEIGYELFLFLVGVRMDLELIRKSGRKVVFTGILCLLAPLITSMVLQKLLMTMTTVFKLTKDQMYKLPYITSSYCMTSSPVIVLLLEELNLLNSEIGRLAVAASSISELFSTLGIGFSAVLYRMAKVKGVVATLLVFTAVVGPTLAFLFIFRPMMFWVIRQTPQNKPVKKGYVNTILVVMLSVAILSHYYGHTFHFMIFILGLSVPAGQPLGSTIEELLHVFTSQVLLPIYVTVYSMRANFRMVNFSDPATVITAIVIVSIFVTKVIGTMVAPLYWKMPLNDAFVLALILSSKGIVQVSIYGRFKNDQTASESIYALALASILVTATLVPLIVKRLYDPAKRYAAYERRDIMHLKPNAELKILACIHRSGNIPAIINLLDAACPSKENPIAIYVLHLMELIGRSSPVFISHQMQTKSISNAYSDNVVLYFNEFVRENLGAVTLNVFTAISRPKYMQEDICTLAMDNLTSLIVLPFHRTWTIDGSIDSEDNAIRALNRNVLERSPCSVGILVDCGHLGRSTSVVASGRSFSVVVIFFGGADDREALTFAKRMACESMISLSVIRIVAMNNGLSTGGGGEWDKILDNEMLKELKHSQVGEGSVKFSEEVVKDGPQTTVLLKSVVDDYDLIIVGRRFQVECSQTAGLNEWSDFPELGTIGDLLASPDVNCKASILVIKHQQQIT
ncbi:cation/H(+) antiporter 4-like [Argentina anserina]|uniref:cation/H(+) antiporter 4-like n=1 Tax=Argentina anserina TaxID=57926 RepID=UPI0021767A05|nr:cation/H(+) antiporter 4-like [Potentilla anserina]